MPLGDVLGPDEAFPTAGVSRPVTVSGSYLPAEQFEVRRGETLGVEHAVVTPLRVANGSVLLVVRGRADGANLPLPPSGEVDADGRVGAVRLSGFAS